ncbi:MAG TPA: hypothetical protein VGE94_02930 [Chloroflexota bacterium]
MAAAILAIGWLAPVPEAELQPNAAELGLAVWLAALLVPLWPTPTLRRAADLDTRLGFGDRLATAWAFRDSTQAIVRLQRADAIARLEHHSPQTELRWRPGRVELAALGLATFVALVLTITPSPQQPVLRQQAAERAAVERAAERLAALRLDAAHPSASLTAEQARRLDELLQQAQTELQQARTQREAAAIVARAQDLVDQQLTDPNADLRDEALAAMSETLAAEPLTRALGDALQHEDAASASQALGALMTGADRLSDVQRQALSRALQRAANVGRAEPASASALRAAAQALLDDATASTAAGGAGQPTVASGGQAGGGGEQAANGAGGTDAQGQPGLDGRGATGAAATNADGANPEASNADAAGRAATDPGQSATRANGQPNGSPNNPNNPNDPNNPNGATNAANEADPANPQQPGTATVANTADPNNAANGQTSRTGINPNNQAAATVREPGRARAALAAADVALSQAIQAARGQAAVRATTQRLRDVQTQLGPGYTVRPEDLAQLMTGQGKDAGSTSGFPLPAGTPVAIDSVNGGASFGLRDPSMQPGGGAGQGVANLASRGAADRAAGSIDPSQSVAAENVFVPGREGNGPTDRDLIDQPFTVRGAPRPYRDVLSQYAQSSRDYVDRPDVSPAVRDMVKDYFLKLEEGQ